MTDTAAAARGAPDGPVPDSRALPRHHFDHRWAVGLVVALTLFTRVVWLDVPQSLPLFDEVYYVNAARVMLGIPPSAHYAGMPRGLDPNTEHPPLGKVLMAGSIRLLGDNPYGWRMVSILCSLGCTLLLYAVVRAVGGTAGVAVTAAALFSADNLVLVNSRTGMLDIPSVCFMLLAVWWALRDRPAFAGAALGAACLIKLPAVFGLVGLVLWYCCRAGLATESAADRFRRLWREAGLLSAAFAIAFVIGLWALDLAVTTYRTPWDHLAHMLQHGFSLTRYHGGVDPSSPPWAWLVNDGQINYRTSTPVSLVHGKQVVSSPSVYFRGAMNPFIIGAAPLAVSYTAWRVWRFRDALSLWVVLWIVATYLPYYALALGSHRITYIYYFLPTLPAVAVALAQFLGQAGLPRTVAWSYLAAVGIGFVEYFPFRSLP